MLLHLSQREIISKEKNFIEQSQVTLLSCRTTCTLLSLLKYIFFPYVFNVQSILHFFFFAFIFTLLVIQVKKRAFAKIKIGIGLSEHLKGMVTRNGH